MHVKHLSEAKRYEAPNHRGYCSLRLFGLDAGGPRQFTVGLSHFLPGGGAGPDASPTEKVYYVLSGELTLIAGGRDDMYWSVYRNGLRADDEAGRVWAESVVDEPDTIAFDEVQEAPELSTIDALLTWVLGVLDARGFAQVVVVDLTRHDIRIPVVHVTVPGLEGPITKCGYTPGPRMQELLAARI